MGLRVMLADKTENIKKWFQSALQDYGVEILTPSSNEDHLTSLQKAKPDIVFLDVLLKNKSGYEVSQEIKSQKDLAHLPIVLLWTHFTTLDENKFKSSLADEHLEKPFSVESLRNIVQKLVPKTKTQPLSQFLTFPTIEEKTTAPLPSALDPKNSTLPSTSPSPEKKKEESQESFLGSTEDILLEPSGVEEENLLSLEEEDNWVQENIFKADNPSSLLDSEEEENTLFSDEGGVSFSSENLSKARRKKPMSSKTPLSGKSAEENLSSKREEEKLEKNSLDSLLTSKFNLSEDHIYRQSQKIIESIAWQIVPELASQMVEKELKRLLEEKDQEI